MTLIYAIAFAAALLMLAVYFRVDHSRNVWLMLLFICVCVCNAGYLLLSLSKTLTAALISNSVAYLGNVFLPLFILMMVIRLSQIKLPKWLPGVLVAVNIIMFLIASSGGYSRIYYKEVSFELIDGAHRLVKVYGPLHFLYKIFLFAYFGAMVAIICFTHIKKTAISTKHTAFLAIVVIGNIALWLAENLINTGFEFLAISYIMTEMLILMLYSIINDHESSACVKVKTALHIPESALDIPSHTDEPDGFSLEQISLIFSRWPQTAALTQREHEVLGFILEHRKRKDIAQVLFVTESTIKKHTTNIYKKLGVTCREELFATAKEKMQ